MNEYDLSLKMYDIVTMKKQIEDQSCDNLLNETFTLPSDTKRIKVLQDPRQRVKRIAAVDLKGQETNRMIARSYKRDHKDAILNKKIPEGYKIFGIKGLKSTHNEEVLHFIDFLIWKPPRNWLSVEHLLP